MQQRLDHACNGHFGLVALTGATGTGKTSLARSWPAARPTFQRFIVEFIIAAPQLYTTSCRQARDAAPMNHAMAWRALAYAADAAGAPQRALEHLAQAEQEAQAFGQQIDVAIARYQRGQRLSGAAGAELITDARALLARTGAGAGLLDEDAGLRG